jgi:hypothetical protein
LSSSHIHSVLSQFSSGKNIEGDVRKTMAILF